MSDEVEVFSDNDGAILRGSPTAIQAFLTDHDWLPSPIQVPLTRLSELLRTGGGVAEVLSGVSEQSAMYLKLTPESARRLRETGSLMKTKTKGVSYAMLGKVGDKSMKWLEVQDGTLSMVTNPAVLSGVGALLIQAAQQAEAQELKALLVQIDEKLDDVRRAQKDEVLAEVMAAAAEIKEAMTIREHGGDPKTLWDKVSKVSGDITRVQEKALAALGALADKVAEKKSSGHLKKVARHLEQEVAEQLAILSRCFELHNEFKILELDHVLDTAPERLEGHRTGLIAARDKRRDEVLERTRALMERMSSAAEIAKANIVGHPIAAPRIIESLNGTGELVAGFHRPLGIEMLNAEIAIVPFGEAIKDPEQWKAAGREAGPKIALGAAAALGAIALAYSQRTDEDEEAEESSEDE